MAAFVALTIPLQITSPEALEDALSVLENTPGSEDVAIDAAGHATLKLQFPGNIDALIGKLRSKRVLTGLPLMGVSLPVQSMEGVHVDAADVFERLRASATLSNIEYDGTTVTATAVASTSALRYIFEELVNAGVMPISDSTPAGFLEFVL
jgi:hypothetical protein